MNERRLEWRIALGAVFTAVVFVVLAGMAVAATFPGKTIAYHETVETRAPKKALPILLTGEEPEEAHDDCREQELEMLAMVIYQEAGGDACSDETRQMVGEVVLNRVADHRYPDTLYEVLAQPYQYGRLAWRFDWPERAQNPGEAHAVERAYHIAAALLTGSVERLLPEDVIFQSEHIQGTEIVAHVDGFYFC